MKKVFKALVVVLLVCALIPGCATMSDKNRTQAEEVAAEEISRERNRELARMAAEAEAEIELPDFSAPNEDLPPGF